MPDISDFKDLFTFYPEYSCFSYANFRRKCIYKVLQNKFFTFILLCSWHSSLKEYMFGAMFPDAFPYLPAEITKNDFQKNLQV